jgi:hypothetical protein
MVELSEEDKNNLANIDNEYKKFLQGMVDANAIITKSYQEFKTKMEEDIEDYKREVSENHENFKKNAPFNVVKGQEASTQNKSAFDQIAHYVNECKRLRQQEEEMTYALEIFELEPSNYTLLT